VDYGHQIADDELKKLEKRLKKEYSKAAAEAHKKAMWYLDGFRDTDEMLRAKVKSGDMTEKMYKQWRTETLTMGSTGKMSQSKWPRNISTQTKLPRR
jgi:hypothetical protein